MGMRHLCCGLLLVVGCLPPPPPPTYGPAQPQPEAQTTPVDPYAEPAPDAWGAAEPSAPATSLSIQFPATWQTIDGWHVFTREQSEWAGPRVWRTLVRVLPPSPAQGDFNQSLLQAAQTYFPAELQGRQAPNAYRRYIGDGLLAQFVYAVGPERGNKDDTWFTLYQINCGQAWERVEVASIYQYPGVSGPVNVGVGEAQEAAEPVLSTIRCAGAKNEPLFEPATFARHWYFGSGAAAEYVNIYTGASSTRAVSYAGDYDLRADGTALYRYSGATTVAGATAFGGQEGTGTWSFKGDILTIAIRGLQPRIYRVATVANIPNGMMAIMIKPEWAAMPTATTNPEVVFTTQSTYAK